MNFRALASYASTLLFAAASSVFASLAHAATPSPLPPLPAPDGAPVAPGSPVNPGDPTALLDRAKRGVVTIERDGHVLEMGMVLQNDGRVVTALSPLGAVDTAEIRFVDGSTARARVGHRDKAWDLALLVPLSGKWSDGLSASEVDPSAIDLHTFVPRPARTISPIALHAKAFIAARAKEGDALNGAIDVDTKGTPVSAGAPLVDPSGGVVGILVRACKSSDSPAAPCAPIMVAAPVSALRNFLVHTPVDAVAPSPWLGIVGESDASGAVHGVRVMAVAPQSPAEHAALKANTDRTHADLIAAVDGQPIQTPEKLAELISKHAIGENVKLLVLTNDKYREVVVTLRAAP